MTKTYISKLRLKSFKSFHKPVVLDFSPGLNCVIGANGSGKSNTLDALCFVLGRLSTKSIRAENYSDLIHKSKIAPNSNGGEVLIRLDNQARAFPVESNALDVSRAIMTSGQTQYRINQKRATRSQTLDMLGTNKIMPEGHNIILQGDIERFVSMSSTEKRQLIEEVAGIWVYESKKEAALKELKKVAEKLREVEIVMNEKGNYMKSLESEKQTAEKYRSYQNELEQARASEFNIRFKQLTERKANVSKKLGGIEKKNSEIDKKSKELQSKITVLENKLEVVEKEIEKRGGEAQLELQRDIDSTKRNLENSKSIIKSSENEIKRIDVRKQQLQNNLEELNKKVKEKQSEIESLKKDRKELENKKSAIEKSVGLSEHDLKNIDKTLDDKERELDNLRIELAKVKEGIQKYVSELKIFEFKLEQLDGKLSEAREKEKQVKEVKRGKDRYKQLVLEINGLLSEDSKLSDDVQDLRVKLHAKEDESARLRSTINAAQDLIMRDKAVSKVLSAKNKIKGILGTVAELGRIEPKLKTALSVAAGGRLKNIVVDNENTAINCLQLLRETKSGVGTFLPLNKVVTRPMSAQTKLALGRRGVVGLASDLISCDSKFKRVFEHIFRDTLVVENTSVAKSMGVGRYNMVTLEGDLFGSSGAITGGFRRDTGFSFVEKDSGKKMDKLLGETEKITKEIKSREKEKRKLEKTLFELRAEKAELEGRIGIIDEDELSTADVKAEKLKLLQTKTQFTARIKALGKKENDLTEEVNKKTVEKNKIKSQVKDLQFGKKKQELNDLESKLSLVEGKLSVAETLMENSLQLEKRNIAKVLLGLAKEREEFLVQISKEKTHIKQSQTSLIKKEVEQKDFFGKLKRLFSDKDSVSEQIRTSEKKYREIREQLLGEDEEKNALTIANAKIDAELGTVKTELEPLQGINPLPHLKTVQDSKKRQSELRRRIEDMGNVNMKALEIFETAKKEFEKLSWRVNKLGTEKGSVEDVIGKIESKKKETFLETFTKINDNFSKTLGRVSERMSGSLLLENPDSPFEGGVKVELKDANKSNKSVFSLSGGEKTLTALAFIFAIQSVDPAPFYLLDEIDAALDKVNSEKVAQLLKEYSEKAQVIIISHNDSIIHAADTIYGVWKTKDGISQINSLRI